MSNQNPENKVRHKLLIAETLILAVPLAVLAYVLYQSGHELRFHHLILLCMLITLILAGLIIVRQIFDKITIMAVSLKKAESGDSTATDIQHDIAELHDITNTFNSLVKKLEETTEGLKRKQLELLTIKDITEMAKEVRNIDSILDLLLEKSMSVTGAQTGSVLMVERTTPTNRGLVALHSQFESAANLDTLYRFRIVAARGHAEALEKDSIIGADNFLARNVLIDNKPLIIQDIEKDARTLKPNDPKYGPPSFLSMPIFAENQLVAVMNLSNKASGQLFGTNDEQLLSIMLGEISFVLENAKMNSNLQQQLQTIQDHNVEMEKEIAAHKRTEKALRESEKRYKELLNFLPISVFEIDKDGKVTTVNQNILDTFGYTQDDVARELNAAQMFIPEDLDRVQNDIQRVLNGERKEKRDGALYTMARKNGSTFPALVFANAISYMNIVVGCRGAIIDFTERRKAEEALRRSEEQHRLLIETLPLAVFVHIEGKIAYVNPAFLTLFKATSADEVVGMRVVDFVPSELFDTVEERRRIMTEEKRVLSPLEMNIRCMDGTVITVISTPMPIIFQGKPAILAVFQDITKRKRSEFELQKAHKLLQIQINEIKDLQDKMKDQAIRDALTGLFNRHYLKETLGREFANALREGFSIGVVMIDIDHFKRVNDTHGHKAGDLILQALGTLLLGGIRTGDIACRYGGEEFLLVLPKVSKSITAERAEQLRTSFEALNIVFGEKILQATISLGVAVFSEDGGTADAVIQAADQAMYRAKASGRNRVILS